MTLSTVELSFPDDLLFQIDQIADNESRTRDVFVRNAVKMYIKSKNDWQECFNIGQKIGSNLEISEDNVMDEIKAYRKEKNQ